MSVVVVDALGIVFFGLNIIAVVKVIILKFFESFQLQIEKGEKKVKKKRKKVSQQEFSIGCSFQKQQSTFWL